MIGANRCRTDAHPANRSGTRTPTRSPSRRCSLSDTRLTGIAEQLAATNISVSVARSTPGRSFRSLTLRFRDPAAYRDAISTSWESRGAVRIFGRSCDTGLCLSDITIRLPGATRNASPPQSESCCRRNGSSARAISVSRSVAHDGQANSRSSNASSDA